MIITVLNNNNMTAIRRLRINHIRRHKTSINYSHMTPIRRHKTPCHIRATDDVPVPGTFLEALFS